MIEKSVEWFVFLGTSLRFLQDASSHQIKGNGHILQNIDVFLERLEEINLNVTIRASSELIIFRDELEKSKLSELTEGEIEKLKRIMSEIRPTLMAEAEGMATYIVSERRFPIGKLLYDPGSFFGAGVFPKLPVIAQQDFAEATKCLAFERPTAAAFHMLRAAEATLMFYYCQKIRRKRAELTWGAITHSMKSMPKRFPSILLNHLDHIRSSFRNPTAHPEKIYDLDETQDLFSISADISNRMIQDLKL